METMEGVGSLWGYQEQFGDRNLFCSTHFFSDHMEISPLFVSRGFDDLRHRLLCTTLELEAPRTKSEQVIRRNQEKINQLLILLQQTYQQRDEAREQLQTLRNNFFLNESMFPLTPICNSNITSSDSLSNTPQKLQSHVSSSDQTSNIPMAVTVSTVVDDFLVANRRPLPEKGKLKKAVMDAGPLLKTLLMAGPLPQWRNPPPIQPHQVPTIGFSRKIRNRGVGYLNYQEQIDDGVVGRSPLFLPDVTWNSDGGLGLLDVRKRPLLTSAVGFDNYQTCAVKSLRSS